MDSLLVWKGLRKKPGMQHPGCADAPHGLAAATASDDTPLTRAHPAIAPSERLHVSHRQQAVRLTLSHPEGILQVLSLP